MSVAAVAGVALEEYLDHRCELGPGGLGPGGLGPGGLGPGEVLWENNGWSVRGTAGGNELLLWTSPYLLASASEGPFRRRRFSAVQTLLVLAGPEALDGPLIDAPFLAAGWDERELLGWDAVEVGTEAGGDGATLRWKAAGRTVSSRAGSRPGWHLGGAHAGVGLDVALIPEAAAIWLAGATLPRAAPGDRWFVANGSATGTLSLAGRSLALEGHAVHERHVHLADGYDPLRLLRGDGVTWHTARSDVCSLAVLSRPSLGRHWAQAVLDGKAMDLSGPGAVSVEVTAQWTDPLSRFVVPSAWSLRLRHEEGELRLETAAHRRAYHLWSHLSGGETVCYWWLATSAASWHPAGGRARQLGVMRSEAHQNRTFVTSGPTSPESLLRNLTESE